MKTVLQALKDEIYYPINDGLLVNKLIARGVHPEEECTMSFLGSDAWKGALADSLLTLIQAVNISEGDKSYGALTDTQRRALLLRINNLYGAIGEEEVQIEPTPMVSINPESWM